MLSTKEPMIDYDSKFDIMYYSDGDTSHSYGDENIDNIVVVKDISSDEVVGYTIMNYKKMSTPNTEQFKELMSVIGKTVYDKMMACFDRSMSVVKM